MATDTFDVNVDEIRTVIERWAASVQRCDLDGVLAHHGDEIVMFDVPSPQDGVRGIDAYASTWPDFFEWIAGGARFEIVDLHIEAGADVAFAWALMHCGTPEDLAADPDHRLRLSFGLRRQDGAWRILHEHHSFTHDPAIA